MGEVGKECGEQGEEYSPQSKITLLRWRNAGLLNMDIRLVGNICS